MTRPPLESSIDIRLCPAATVPELETLWRELESRAEASIFISWSWIGIWLANLPSHIEVQVLQAHQRGLLVGLALVVVGRSGRPRIARGGTAHLHSTGQLEYDGLAIEHNGLLLDRRYARATRSALLRYLCDGRRSWRSVQLPGLSAAQVVDADALPCGTVMQVQQRECAVVPLQTVRDRSGDYVGLLSVKRRAHIRRSLRACAEWGPLSVSVADDPVSAFECFERLVQLHRQRRAALGQPSSFDTPHSLSFHRRLIGAALPRGEVQLLRVRAGEHDIGCLYSFVHRGRVSLYQSGYDYARIDARFSPGLVTLAAGIEHNARLGLDCFDFLAGDAFYKRTLATGSEPLYWVELHRDGPMLRAEEALRRTARRSRDWMRGLMAGQPGNLGLVLVGFLNETPMLA